MSRTVELPDDVYQRLAEEASAAGTTPAAWVAARFPKCCIGDEGTSRAVELSDEVYQQLEEEAAAVGTTPAEWIAAQLPKRCQECEGSAPAEQAGSDSNPGLADEVRCAPAPQKTLADRLAGKIGRISSGRSDLSERVSEIFADGLMEKRRTGHL